MDDAAVPPLDVFMASPDFQSAPIENKIIGINNAFDVYAKNPAYTPEQHYEVKN